MTKHTSKKRQASSYKPVRTLSSQRVTVDEAASSVYELLNTPVSLGCWIRLKHGDMQGLVSMKVHPSSYQDTITGAAKFRKDYLAVSLLSKLDRDIGLDTRGAAIAKWREAEEMNRATNRRLRAEMGNLDYNPSNPVQEVFHLARRNISSLLGPFKWRHAFGGMNFGPGATQQTKGRVSLFKKYSAMAVAPASALTTAAHIIGFTPNWYESLTGTKPDGLCCYLGVTASDAAKVEFVNKKATTKRAIAIENGLGIYLQKGLGAVIRRRLSQVGIDLNDQSHNQVLASRAVELQLATIDLSMASDTVSSMLVRMLMPDDWFMALNSVRSRYSLLDDELILTEKFSSMGNGFTFELESLLFWALSKACQQTYGVADEPLGVYGDDIIVPSSWARELVDVLSYCGFKTNVDKTFIEGPFRESCGKHYFEGLDVQPFFIRKDFDGPEDYFRFYNQVSDYLVAHGFNGRGRVASQLLARVFHSLRPNYRYFVPKGWGSDTGFHNNPWNFRHLTRYRKHGWDVYRFPFWGSRAATVEDETVSTLVARLAVRNGPRTHFGGLVAAGLDYEPLAGMKNRNIIRVNVPARRTVVGYTHSWNEA